LLNCRISGSRLIEKAFWGYQLDVVYSVNGAPIRLTEERWQHIVNNKPYMEAYYDRILSCIEKPTWILHGYAGSLIAVLSVAKQRYLHVVYKEIGQNDGFVITAFIAKKHNRKMIIWAQNT